MGPRSYLRSVESSFTGAGSIIHESGVTVNQLTHEGYISLLWRTTIMS